MKRKIGRIASVLLAVLTLLSIPALLMFSISGNEMPFTGKTAEICDLLMEQGFPEDYAIALTKLKLLHPNWSFVPLEITETNANYTWDHVIDQETASPKINLVSAANAYSAYWHPTNRELYDAGYYQPSREAVEYFMDPRNFLNEADVFQFYDLSDGILASEEAVDAVLAGSFMENAELENGKTYTEYLIEIGEEIGIDAVYLAVKLRQEQGSAGNSPIISGNCGDVLWRFYREQKQYTDGGDYINPPKSGESEAALTALNGLYNPFNLNASGDGIFAIYKNAMTYAQKGTASMREKWGGSPAWDTDWKGIYGGALYIKEKYVDRYQSTIYLQKFNVDGRNVGNNFGNQYMQNIFGAVSEGRSFYQSFASNDTLDADCQFLIPVYLGMPSQICGDPANGKCESFAPASARYQTTALITHPQRLRNTNDGVYGSLSVVAGTPLEITGTFTHSYGIKRLEYSFDGVEWVTCSESGSLELRVADSLPDYGDHLLLIRGEAAYDANNGGKRLNRYFLCAAFHLTLLPPPSVNLTLQSGNAVSEKLYYAGTEITLPVSDAEGFVGWLGSNGTLLPSGAALTLESDVAYTALFADFRLLEGAAVSTELSSPRLRFSAVIPQELAKKIAPHATVSVDLLKNAEASAQAAEVQQGQPITSADGTVWQQWHATTPALEPEDYSTLFSADFFLLIQYSNGATKRISASGDPFSRSVLQIVNAVLDDRSTAYSAETRGLLYSFTQHLTN